MKTISVQRLNAVLKENGNAVLVDVRTPSEFASVHVPGARLFPLERFSCDEVLASFHENAPLYFICHSGMRAQKAAEKLSSAAPRECIVVEGGTQAWEAAGLPVERSERQTLPLDRQLQITIGILVLTGVFLAHFVNPAWIWLSGFVGAGLVFAGLTGICLMRSLLASMPWNQASEPAAHSCCTANK